MRPLFIAGCPRSGTTALTEYLNQHEEVLVCIERYKYAPPPQEITPSLFTFDRILDYREGETNTPRERHVKLLDKKDPAKLKWIGDKRGMYFKWFEQLAENNPGARFIVIHRPIEEVARSFEARKNNPNDHWWADSTEAVSRWNLAIKRTREFVESSRSPVLIVHYHDFSYRNEACASLISQFLGVEFGPSLLERWEEKSQRFESRRRQKKSLSAEQLSYIRENKDQAGEEWILGRIEEQWKGKIIPTSEDDVAPGQQKRGRGLGERIGRIKARVLGNG